MNKTSEHKIAKQIQGIINNNIEDYHDADMLTISSKKLSKLIVKMILDAKPKEKDKSFYETDIRYNKALKEWQDNMENNNG